MARGYVYKKPVRRSQYSNFRRYLIIFIVLLAAFGGVAYYIYAGLRSNQKPSALSAVEESEITGNKQTYTNDYFQFEDSGTWIFDKKSSSPQRIVYHKYRKNQVEAEMLVYINNVPIPLYLDTPRVLPVRIVNDTSLAPTNVSLPCVSQYAKGELHRVKEISIDGATMICDPDSPEYFVILSEISGDYRLNFKRSNGVPLQLVITFKDLTLDPSPTTIMNIASSFQVK